MGQYDKYPKIKVKNYENGCILDYQNILKILKHEMQGKKILVVETYPGVHDQEVISQLQT